MSGRLARETGSALSWQTIQQIAVRTVYLVRILVLARLLTPDDFGLLAIAVIAVQFLLQVTEFGMIPALVQRKGVDDRYYDSAWTVGLVRAFVVSAVVILLAPVIADLFGDPRATSVIRVLALQPLLVAGASIKVAALQRRLQFRALACLHIAEALASAAISIGAARPFGVWALVAGSLGGSVVYLAVSYVVARHRPRLRLDREAAAALIRFGRWIFVTSLIGVLGRSALHAVISRRLGVAELGIYFLAARLAFLPAAVVGGIVGSVAFPVYARLQADRSQAARAFRMHIIGTCSLLLPAAALVVALAATLTEEVLGPRWAGTAPVIGVLAIASVLGLVGDATVNVFRGVGQPYKVAILEAAQTSLLVGLVWWLAGTFGVTGAASAWLPALLVSQIICVALVRGVFARPFEGVVKPIVVVAAISAIGGLAAVGLDRVLPGLIGLVAGGGCGVLAMGWLLWQADRRLDFGLVPTLERLFPSVAAALNRRRAEVP